MPIDLRLIHAALPSLVLLVAACGEPSVPPPTTPSAPPPATPSAPPPATPAAVNQGSAPATWSKDMPNEQKMAFMKKNVMPSMGPVFQGHDASRYASFGCKTCHGPELKDPHEYLSRLTLKGGNLTAFAEKPEVAKFMAEQVAPKMAAAMGLPPFDPKTNQGFGCGGCHAIDMK